MFMRQVAVILLFSLLNTIIGCTTIVNRSPEEFMKKPQDRVYGINVPLKVHSVKTHDDREYLFEEECGYYDIKSQTIFCVTDSAENIAVGKDEIASILLMERRGGEKLLVESDPQLFHRRLEDFRRARIAGRVTPVTRIVFSTGYYDETREVIKGFLEDGSVVEEKMEDVMSLRIRKPSYTKYAILVLMIAGFWVGAILWEKAWE